MKILLTRQARPRSSAVCAGFVIFFALGLAQVHAQDSEQTAPEDPNDAPVSQAEETVSTEPEALPADQTEGTVLEDYEASEQISEDLSVSFPVDI